MRLAFSDTKVPSVVTKTDATAELDPELADPNADNKTPEPKAAEVKAAEDKAKKGGGRNSNRQRQSTKT